MPPSISISFHDMERHISTEDDISDYIVKEDSHITLRVDTELKPEFFAMLRLSAWKVAGIKHYDVATRVIIKPRH